MTVFSSFFCFLSTYLVLIWLLVWFAFLPCATASQPTTPFPEIKFSVFNKFISSTFNSNISLATVLMIFFTLVENPELLNLHARQKHPQLSSEKSIISSAWMRALCRQLKDHLPDEGFVSSTLQSPTCPAGIRRTHLDSSGVQICHISSHEGSAGVRRSPAKLKIE